MPAVGTRIKITPVDYDMKCWDTPYGLVFLYIFKDELYKYIWKTSVKINDEFEYIRATVKNIVTYN